MKIQFIGGAHEIGGSCTFLQVGEKRLVIDAGIRMGGAETDRLPDLSKLQEHGPVDAVVITHAHTDHIGSLPLLHLAYPEAPFYTTEPTLELMRILLADSLKIMEARWLQEQEIPLYPEHAVLAMLSRVKVVPLGEMVSICNEQIQLTFLLSGHVLGACSVTMDTADGRVFFTGDYSIDEQRTVDGFVLPAVRPHVVISEATYGNRMHANRRAEEMRLAENVAAVVAAGGKVLIPAFALGRAQEVLLILMHEQKVGRIPPFPLYVDGMVRNICQVYAHFGPFLGERLRKKVAKEGNPFFFPGSPAIPVGKNRQAIVDGPPCCIVSSSGMLTGGPSQWYATQLAQDPKSAIFITGYQDEESPGRKVLAVAEGKERTLTMMGQQVTLQCQVGKYGLSAHADAGQMASVISRLEPHTCYLVHGDESARSGLVQALPPSIRVKKPRNGELFEHSFSSTLKKKKPVSLTADAPAKARTFDAQQLRITLLEKGHANRTFTLEELAQEWFGPDAGEAELASVREAFRTGDPKGYARDHRRPTLIRLVGAAKENKGERWTTKPVSGLVVARKMFAQCDGLKAIGERQETRELLFSVAFPSVFRTRHAERLAELESKTGYTVVLRPGDTPRQLGEVARRLLPSGWKLTRAPSILGGQRVRLRVRVAAGETGAEAIEEYRRRVAEETAHDVEIDQVLEPETTAPARELLGPDGKMELNSAYRTVKDAFAQVGLEVYRCGRRSDALSGTEYLETGLLAPWLAEPHLGLLQRLETVTGYPVRLSHGVNQSAVEQWFRLHMPSSWTWLRLPKFYPDKRLVVLVLVHPPEPEEVEAVRAALLSKTGLQLQVETA